MIGVTIQNEVYESAGRPYRQPGMPRLDQREGQEQATLRARLQWQPATPGEQVMWDFSLVHAIGMLLKTMPYLLFRVVVYCGIATGYDGPGMKTILPHRAYAKLDSRLVPNQTFKEAEEIFRQIAANGQ